MLVNRDIEKPRGLRILYTMVQIACCPSISDCDVLDRRPDSVGDHGPFCHRLQRGIVAAGLGEVVLVETTADIGFGNLPRSDEEDLHLADPAHRRSGFALIELLVVITILVTLLGLLMPLMGLASRESKKSATRTVMVKVDAALRLFRSEIGPYPFQTRYADLASGEAWSNRLYYHLGTDIADDKRAKVITDADAAAAIYVDGPTTNPNSYTDKDSREGWSAAYMANRMARERVRLALYSGNTGVTSGVMQASNASWRDKWGGAFTRRVLPTTPLLSSPASVDCPGWAKDYLKGEVPKSYISGEGILDAWNHPLLYVCQVVEGMNSAPHQYSDSGSTDVSALSMGLHALGRKTLAPTDTITGIALVVNPPALPDLANLRHSDRRLYAPRGLETEFELWSAGPDGKADWMRDAAANNDNVPLQPYDKGIP